MLYQKVAVIACLAALTVRRCRSADPGAPAPGSTGPAPTSGPGVIDDVCTRYCDEYFELCLNNNAFVNANGPRAIGGRRGLVTSAEVGLGRANDLSVLSEGLVQCQKACMLYPRGQDPATYSTVQLRDTSGLTFPLSDADKVDNIFNSNLGGDTLWCRARHLSLARDFPPSMGIMDPDLAAFHCYHAGPQSAGICRDSNVNGFTPYELLRAAQPTRRRFGRCDIAGEGGEIADCTDSGVTDENIAAVLEMLDPEIEVLFLNGNPGITVVGIDTFSDFTNLRALYLNDCEIYMIEEGALDELAELRIFNADSNKVADLPESLLDHTPHLLQFSMFFNRLTEIPRELFYDIANGAPKTPLLERIVLYGQPITHFYQEQFWGLTELKMLSLVDCSFNDKDAYDLGYAGTGVPDGTGLSVHPFPDDVFRDLHSLEFFDFFGNLIRTLETRWFVNGDGSSWSGNLLRLAFWNNPLEEVEQDVFEYVPSLEMAYFHYTALVGLGSDQVAQLRALPNFAQLTVNDVPFCGGCPDSWQGKLGE